MPPEAPIDHSRPYVKVSIDESIAWVRMDRPEKRNAMNPTMNRSMVEVLDALELDDRCSVVVLTGVGESFSAGMDIKEYFRDTDHLQPLARYRVYREAADWHWRRLRLYAKPTIAMINGWCLGGGLTPMIACDIAISAFDAKFGLSEINWGIIPAGNVAKALTTVMSSRAALYYIMTGELFDGQKALELGLITEAVARENLETRTREIALSLATKNASTLRQAKISFKNVQDMDWEVADDYLRAKQEEGRSVDSERSRQTGMKQFLDEKVLKPGIGSART